MDRTVARVRLANMVSASARPVLAEQDLDALLDSHRTLDSQGLAAGDDNWTPTYNLNAAAAEGWRWKAGRVAGDFSFSADGASFSKGDVQAKCLEMERRYAALDYGTSTVAEPLKYSGPYDSPRLVL